MRKPEEMSSIKSVKLDGFGRIEIVKDGHQYPIIINEKEVEAVLALRILMWSFK